MRTRLSRAEQSDRNRAELFAAARRVFLAKGYHAATLEQIADEAGFSKGVVYSRFASKADMFLALLEERITERATQNAAAARRLAGSGDFGGLLDLAQQAEHAAPGWRLLVLEFRIHAARDPELNRRYAAVHARTVEGIARVLVTISQGDGETLPSPPRQLAELLLAIEAGIALEQAANPDALGGPDLPVLARLNRWLAPASVPTREET
jgi:AcrR family transcriptional regulator